MGYICPKTTFFELKHIQRIYLTLLSTTSVKIHQTPYVIILHKSFFTTQLVCFILAQTLHTFDKNILSKCKFSDFPLFEFKFIKFLMYLFKQKVNFSSKFGSLFSVMRDNSSALFSAETLYAIDKSSTSKCRFSDLPLLELKFAKFVMYIIFETKSQFFFKLCITLHCHER